MRRFCLIAWLWIPAIAAFSNIPSSPWVPLLSGIHACESQTQAPVLFDGRTNNFSGRWRAELEGVVPGSNRLDVVAWHPSGRYHTNAVSIFTNNTASDTLTNSYDGNGNVSVRVWKNGSGAVRRTQTFKWDAFDQLAKVTLRDQHTNGYDWSAVYDCLGRRLQTISTVVQHGTNAASSTVIDSTYDPEVEFLEVGVSVSGQGHWFVHGPDASGVYGGMQGLGGLEAIVRDSDELLTTIINDHFGNPVNGIVGLSGMWLDLPVGVYGPLLGYPLRLFGLHVEPIDAMLWRGRRIDVTGLYYVGARYYDPLERRFISHDPLWQASVSRAPHTAFNGDPVNFFDPDGRMAKGFFKGATRGDYAQYGDNLDQELGGFLGQVGTGLVPIYGQVADVRDWSAAAGEVRSQGLNWRTGIGLGLSTAAFVPLIGDAVKGIFKPALRSFDNVQDFGGQLDDVAAKGLGRYEVGSYNVLREGAEAGLDAHHVGQKALMRQFVEGYDPRTAPSILVPRAGHTVGEGVVSRSMSGFDSPRDVIARDIRELRRVYPDIPNSQLQRLIEMNKQMYPEVRR